MRTTTWTFVTGVAVGYYFGSRPNDQAAAEIKRAGGVGLHFLRDRVDQVQAIRESRATDRWIEAEVGSVDGAASLLYPPDFSFDAAAELARQEREEMLDEVGRESFPSSDPPSTWSGPDDFRGSQR